MKNNRWIPITWGLICNFIAIMLIAIFGLNFITIIPVVVLFFLGMSSLQTGVFGTKRLINEMTNTNPLEPLSEEGDVEYNSIRGINPKKKAIYNVHS